jgi:UDP-N-acetylmuramoyl-tripeptide--D-alanyl-D-alanine ligase
MQYASQQPFWKMNAFLQKNWNLSKIPWNQTSVKNFCVDSRNVKEGDVFIALKGERSDGHLFLEEVFSKGAIGAVVEKGRSPESFKDKCIELKDPLKSLQLLAKRALEEMQPIVIGIGGSLGKTSTKQILYGIVSKFIQTSCSFKSYNGQIGLPLSVLNQNYTCDAFILEMGMNEKGELEKLVDLAPPDLVGMTCIEHVHMQSFESLEELIYEKSKLLSHSKTDCSLIPLDSKGYSILDEQALSSKMTFSLQKKEADYYLEETGEGLDVYYKEKKVLSFLDPLPTAIQHSNLLLSIALANRLGISWENIKKGIGNVSLPERRFEIVEKSGITFINDSYNACMVSMLASLNELSRFSGRRIAILGGMKELGKFSKEHHAKVFSFAVKNADVVFFLGEDWKVPVEEDKDQASIFLEREKKLLESKVLKFLRPGDSVLLKGGNSLSLWTIIENYITEFPKELV